MSRIPIRRRALAALASAGLALGLATTVTSPVSAAPQGERSTYIVQLAAPPVVAYDGGIQGLAATAPTEQGEKVRRSDQAVAAYRAYLDAQRAAVLASAPGAELLYDYDFTFTGFAAKLTADQAAALGKNPAVLSVSPEEIRQLDTSSTPNFLGLTGPNGVWSTVGGPSNAGDGVIVGIVDTGFVPENPSFARMETTRRSDAFVARKFSGECEVGVEAPVRCNNKVIGARYFTDGVGLDNIFEEDYLSPRDFDGHGSHTASTAAGNDGVNAVVDGTSLGTISGMAPQARISVYKACWDTSATSGGCFTTDLLAAIDTAVADGVDVINYSISGSQTSFVDSVELAFFRAASAGVFVAASAGNSGPGSSTVAHNSPWITTVAASTHDRVYEASVTLGNGQTYQGVGLGAAVPEAPLVYAGDVALPGADPGDAKLCFLGTLDPAEVAGNIVLCDRGVIARTDKSKEVRNAGGVGMILGNTSPSSLNADLHFVPTVHVNETARAEILAYINSAPAPTASLSAGHQELGAKAPLMASFSSRGPARAGDGDLLKPDITAPGVDVLAAYSPDAGGNGRNWDFLSGTSMSSPHIAGLAALVIQQNPRWTPMMVKSALMTTASTVDNTGAPISTDSGSAANPFNYGAGHVVPPRMLNPGVVYNSNTLDWQRFLCGVGQFDPDGVECEATGSIDPSDLNVPSISIGSLAGSQTVTRRITNVNSKTTTYAASGQAPPGTRVSVSPNTVTLKTGQSRKISITITRTTAEFDAYTFGSLTWRASGAGAPNAARIPIAVRPVELSAPAEIEATGTSGSAEIELTPGYSGQLTASPVGLKPARVGEATLTNPDASSFPIDDPQVNDHVARFVVPVPRGTTLARFELFDEDYAPGTDLDLFVYRGNELVGLSAAGGSDELVELVDPQAGPYVVYVDLFALAEGETSVGAEQYSWTLGSASAGNLTVDPASQPVTIGRPVTVTATWSGLTADNRWLGRIDYGNGAETIGSTVLLIDP